AVDAGALNELCITDKTGYLLPVDDAAAMSMALAKLLEHPERRKEFGKNSLALANKHDVKVVMPKFVKLYKEVIAENK
ncbi:MAG: hypothetical protein JWO07_733, partial [Candidatus Saccharibacteria bacterium]|nr:hypothetical protein [Candidatus Saccharibacteria bacterium]